MTTVSKLKGRMMDEYDIWTGLADLTPLAYIASLGIMGFLFWVFGAFRDK